MLKLYYAPRSPFALKVRILVHELGLVDKVELCLTDPWKDEGLRALNPLCKVPTLVLADGSALYDSPVICAYLNYAATGNLIPAEPARRFEALKLEALADGLAEAVVRRHVELIVPAGERRSNVIYRQEAAIAAAFDALAGAVPGRSFDLGAIACIAAIMYLDFRSPELAWRDGRPALSRWYEAMPDRPSVTANRIVLPPE